MALFLGGGTLDSHDTWNDISPAYYIGVPEIRGFPLLHHHLGAQNSCEVAII